MDAKDLKVSDVVETRIWGKVVVVLLPGMPEYDDMAFLDANSGFVGYQGTEDTERRLWIPLKDVLRRISRAKITEESLVSEATERGYKVGTVCKDLFGRGEFEIRKIDPQYVPNLKSFAVDKDSAWTYYDGRWAEIIKQGEESEKV